MLLAALTLHLAALGQPTKHQFVETNGTVYSIIKDGNSVYMGGSFSQAGYRAGHGAVVTPGNDFPKEGFPDANGSIYAVVTDGMGGWFIGGNFSQLGQVSVNRLAHLRPDLTVDGTFRPEPNNTIVTLLKAGDTLFVGGDFTNIGGAAINRLAAVSTTMGNALNWSPNPDGQIRSIVADGNFVYAGGSFSHIGGIEVSNMAKIDRTTAEVLRFTSYNSTVNVIRKNAGNIYAGGYFTQGGYQAGYQSYYPGTADQPAFALPKANSSINWVEPDGAGGWYIGGQFTVVGGVNRARLAHIMPDLSVDPNFDPGANNRVVKMQKVGNLLYVVGDFTNIAGSNQNRAGCIDLTSNNLTDWNPNPDNSVYTMAVTSTEVLLGGNFTHIGSSIQAYFARVDLATGALLNSPAVNSTVYSILADGGTAYVGGSFTQTGFNTGSAALVSTTSDMPAFTFPKMDGQVYAVEADGAGGWYIGGNFGTVGGQSVPRLAHILADNSIDPTFLPSPNNSVYSLKLDGSTLYAGGSFVTIGGSTLSGIASLNSTTGVASQSWAPNPNGGVYGIDVDADNVYFSGGLYDVRLNGAQLCRSSRQSLRRYNYLEPQPQQLRQ